MEFGGGADSLPLFLYFKMGGLRGAKTEILHNLSAPLDNYPLLKAMLCVADFCTPRRRALSSGGNIELKTDV